MVKPRVAVLLAAYNGMRWIEQQLASIQAQHQVDVTIFISVDLSSDDTQAWCEGYASQHSNAQVLASPGRLGGAGRNFFRLFRDVDISPFDFIALSDQDDLWHPDKLQRATEYLLFSEPQAYSSNVTAFWPDGRRRLLDKAQPQVAWDHLFEAAGPGCTYVLAAPLASAFKVHLCAHWDAAQAITLHDWFIYAFARSHGYGWYIDSRPGLDYRQHPHNQVGANVGLKSLLQRLSRIRDGWWFGQVALISQLIGRPWAVLPGNGNLSRRTLLALFSYATQCRRRRRDQWMFRLACLLATFTAGYEG